MVRLSVRLKAQAQGLTGAGGLGIEGHTQRLGVFLDKWQHFPEVPSSQGNSSLAVKIGIDFGQFPPFLFRGAAQVINPHDIHIVRVQGCAQ